jgi:hypothetical protein
MVMMMTMMTRMITITITFPDNMTHKEIYRLRDISDNIRSESIPVAAPSKAWVCGRLLAGIASLNTAGGMKGVVR